jgi:hypothetical protein
MFVLNKMVRGKSYDLLSESRVSRTIRKQIVEYEKRGGETFLNEKSLEEVM